MGEQGSSNAPLTVKEKLDALRPFFNPPSRRRNCGREFEDIRPIRVKFWMQDEGRRSSIFQMGSTKVKCLLLGPVEIQETMEKETTPTKEIEVATPIMEIECEKGRENGIKKGKRQILVEDACFFCGGKGRENGLEEEGSKKAKIQGVIADICLFCSKTGPADEKANTTNGNGIEKGSENGFEKVNGKAHENGVQNGIETPKKDGEPTNEATGEKLINKLIENGNARKKLVENGAISVEVCGGALSEGDVKNIKETLEKVILLDKFVGLLQFQFTILENYDGTALAACLNAAGIALTRGNVEIRDSLVACSAYYVGEGDRFLMDPTFEEMREIDWRMEMEELPRPPSLITMAYLPIIEETVFFETENPLHPVVEDMAKRCLITANCNVRNVLLREQIHRQMVSNWFAEGFPLNGEM